MKDKFPAKFVQRIHEMLPKDEWEDFFEHATDPLPKTIRLRNDSRLTQSVLQSSWLLTPVADMPDSFFVQRKDQASVPIGKTLEHFTGQIYVSSLSSMLPVKVLDPQPGEKVLDMCAAPGSKTTDIAKRLAHEGVLVANEPSSSRCKALAANIDRMGVTNAILTQQDGTKMSDVFGQEFHKILVDAPCSSEGFGRRKKDFFQKMWSEKSIFTAAKLQKKLITAGFKLLAPEGEMVYSTCTSAPEENEAVVEYLLKQFPEAELLPIDMGGIPHTSGLSKFFDQKFEPRVAQNTCRIWPHKRTDMFDSEMFFVAKIRKNKALKLPPPERTHPHRLKVFKKNQNATVVAELCKYFGMERRVFGGFVFLKKNEDLFLTNKPTAGFASRNHHQRAGLKIMEKGHITSEFALHFGIHATNHIVRLNEEDKNRWMEGYDLHFDPPWNFPNGTHVLIHYEDFCLGHGKILKEGKLLKNKIDRSMLP